LVVERFKTMEVEDKAFKDKDRPVNLPLLIHEKPPAGPGKRF